MAKNEDTTRCAAPGCESARHARGFCQKHYDQSRARKTPSHAGPEPAPPRVDARPREATATACSFPGCTALHHAKGYCKSHYSRVRRRGKSKTAEGRASQCEIAGCSKLAVRNRRCAAHLNAVRGGPRRMTKAERLGEIRRRHERMRREIETIRKSFESEKDE